MRTLLFSLFVIGNGFVLADQEISMPFNPSKPISEVSISQWTAEDGLSSNNTTEVFQDSKGLVWITSFNGFMLYDSERFEIYDISTLPILDTDGFYTLAEGKDNAMYLASQGSGIIRHKGGRFENFNAKSGKIPRSVRSLYFGNDGTMYAGTNSDGIYIMKGDSISKYDHPDMEYITVETILEGPDGTIWMGTEGDGLFGMNKDNVIHYTTEDGLLSNEINDLLLSNNQRIYIASNGGLQYFDEDGDINAVRSLKGNYINCLAEDAWGSIWMGAEEGISRWNGETGKTEWIKSKRGIDLVRISSLFFDKEQNMWVTSNRSGLIQLKESLVSNITTPTISGDRINIVHESWDGRRYIGTDKNQLDICDENGCEIFKIKTDLQGNGVRDIFHDTDGTLWLATYAGVIKIQNGRETVYTTEMGMPANNFRLVIKDNQGTFWFGSRSGGLVRFKDEKNFDVFDIGNKLKSNFILALQKCPTANKIYVGTHSGGMVTLNTDTDEVRTYHIKEDDAGVLIFNIDPMPDGTAFVTSNIGPVYFDGDSLKLINLQKDRRSKTYFDIVRDGFGNIWITTNIGILQIKEQDWFDFLEGKISDVPYFVLDENSGMNNKECTGATRSTMTSDSLIYFPTLGGICQMDPKEVNMTTRESTITIRHVYGDQKDYYFRNRLVEIPPGTVRLSFLFSLLSYSAPDRNQFRYRLTGFDKEWSENTYEGSVEYTNLPPGSYTFEVLGSNDGTNWSPEVATFRFRVLPFFYETIGFLFLVGFMVMGVIYGIYRWRLAFINNQNLKLKKVNEELDRFVYSASHEMRSPLSSILGLIQVLKAENEGDEEAEYYRIIENSVKRLDNLIQDITDYSRNTRLDLEIGEVNVHSIIENILDDISYTTNFQKVRHEVQVIGEPILRSDSKRIKIVLSNIIGNAFKHHVPEEAEDPFVFINILKNERGIKVKIADNGPGISPEHQKDVFRMFYRATVRNEGSGLGLYIVVETLNKLKGTLDLKSKPGDGTTFDILFPILEPEE